jgi:S-formylglutathione hydrolase FrmB
VRRQLEQPVGLESAWVWVSLLVLTVLVAAGLVWWSHRRRLAGRARWVRRVGGSLAVLVLGLATIGAWVNSWVGYFPTVHTLTGFLSGGNAVDQPTGLPAGNAVLASGPGGQGGGQGSQDGHSGSQDGQGSRVAVDVLADPGLGIGPGPVYTYLPPGYGDAANDRRRYPVVYLIGGFPGRAADWFVAGLAARTMDVLISQHVVPPMILVSPDAAAGHRLYDSECLNAVGGPQEETFLTRDLLAWTDRHFRTIADRDGRAIGGMSSGGFCALNLGLRHQDTYRVILAMQPYGDPGRSGYEHLAWRRALMAANTPSRYIPRMRFRHPVVAMLDAGQFDAAGVVRARALAEALAARGQQVAFRIEPGDTHSWHAARHGLPYLLDFAAHHLRLRPLPGPAQAGWEDLKGHRLAPVAG